MRNIFCKMLCYKRLNLGQEEFSVIKQIYPCVSHMADKPLVVIYTYFEPRIYTTDLCMIKYALVLTAGRKSDLL
jgi:hypothetical protein